MSTTPVLIMPAVMTSRPRIMMTVSLPKPANALSDGNRPVAMMASMTPSAITSAGIRSQANRMIARPRMARQMAMSGVMRVPRCWRDVSLCPQNARGAVRVPLNRSVGVEQARGSMVYAQRQRWAVAPSARMKSSECHWPTTAAIDRKQAVLVLAARGMNSRRRREVSALTLGVAIRQAHSPILCEPRARQQFVGRPPAIKAGNAIKPAMDCRV